MLELIKELSLLDGVSGDEGAVRERIIKEIDGKCEWSVDPLGNIIAFKKGKRATDKKIQLSAHMDEVGFIITHIGEDGLLRFAPVGGIDVRVTLGKRLRIGRKRLCGVVGLKPIHLVSEEEFNTPPKMDELYIDIGAKDREEAAGLVEVGERAAFESEFIEFGEGFFKCKALDDRAGCALLIELIKGEIEYDTAFTFTVQEENGCFGAMTAGYTVAPDVAIAVETTTAADLPDTPEHKKVCRLGQGPVVSFMDRGTVYNMELYRALLARARQEGIACQPKTGVYGGNEAQSLISSKAGVKVLAVSLPCRYLHSPSCVLQKSDLCETLRLLRAAIALAGGQ